MRLHIALLLIAWAAPALSEEDHILLSPALAHTGCVSDIRRSALPRGKFHMIDREVYFDEIAHLVSMKVVLNDYQIKRHINDPDRIKTDLNLAIILGGQFQSGIHSPGESIHLDEDEYLIQGTSY